MTPEQEKRIREVLGELIGAAVDPIQEQLERARLEIMQEQVQVSTLAGRVDEIVQRIPEGKLAGRSFVMSDDARLQPRILTGELMDYINPDGSLASVAREDLEALRARVLILETRNAEADARAAKFKEYLEGKAKPRRRVDLRVSADPTTASIERATADRERMRADLAAERHAHAETKERLEAACSGASDGARDLGKALADNQFLASDLKKERERHAVTQKALDQFMGACADQTIQIMELRGELLRLKDPDRDGEHLRATAIRTEVACADLRERLREQENMIKKWDAMIDEVTGPHSEGETYADAAVRVIKELRSSRAASVAAFERQRDELQLAKRDRDVCLAMLDALRKEVTDGDSIAMDRVVPAVLQRLHDLGNNLEAERALQRKHLQSMHGVMNVLEIANAQIDSLKPHVTVKAGQSVVDAAIEALSAPCNDCKVLSDEIDRLSEIAQVADGDRIPLAMDLQIARSDIREAKGSIERMAPLVAAAQAWCPQALIGGLTSYEVPLHAAVEAYEAACSADADDDICF